MNRTKLIVYLVSSYVLVTLTLAASVGKILHPRRLNGTLMIDCGTGEYSCGFLEADCCSCKDRGAECADCEWDDDGLVHLKHITANY